MHIKQLSRLSRGQRAIQASIILRSPTDRRISQNSYRKYSLAGPESESKRVRPRLQRGVALTWGSQLTLAS